MAVDCTNTLEVKDAVCNNAEDITVQITGGENDLTPNYGAKTIAGLVKEKTDALFLLLGVHYVWADLAERNAQIGMVLDEKGWQSDTKSLYQYNGTIWVFISSENEFLTNLFAILDNTDITKRLIFDVSNITTGTSRTITMPDKDVTLGDLDINALPSKAIPLDADEVVIADSADSFNLKKVTLGKITNKPTEVIQWETDNATELTWAGGALVDPYVVGGAVNPTATIYPDGTVEGFTDNFGDYIRYESGYYRVWFTDTVATSLATPSAGVYFNDLLFTTPINAVGEFPKVINRSAGAAGIVATSPSVATSLGAVAVRNMSVAVGATAVFAYEAYGRYK